MNGIDPDALQSWCSNHLGECTVTQVERLSGGASMEIFKVVFAERAPIVLRRTRPGLAAWNPIEREFEVVQAAAQAGLPVPQPIAPLTAPLGKGYAMEFIDMETRPSALIYGEQHHRFRTDFAKDVGEFLAALHRLAPTSVDSLSISCPRDLLDEWTETYHAFDLPRPMIAIGIRWLRDHVEQVEDGPQAIVHGDFRVGNLGVDATGTIAVLDWELAHGGNPHEDLGWLCSPTWRFGAPHAVGGICDRPSLFESYAQHGGLPPTPHQQQWWEAFAVFRWAVITMMQAAGRRVGDHSSLEHAVIGRRLSEAEWDLHQTIRGHHATPTC